MLRLIVSTIAIAFIVACSGPSKGPNADGKSTPSKTTTASINSQTDKLPGEKLFRQKCASCHKLDKKLIGPPLKGAAANWESKEDLYLWTRNWQDAVDAGIARAIEIQDYDGSVMTPYPELTDQQLDDIYEYIEKN